MNKNDQTVIVPLHLLNLGLFGSVQEQGHALNDLRVLLAQSITKHQGEPVALPARKAQRVTDDHAAGWNAYHDEIAKLGPLYTHADPGKVERLQQQIEQLKGGGQLLVQDRNELRGEVERLRAALKFYADREHYHFESGNWDTVSGEPLNILWCGDEPDFIEDGTVARNALSASAEPNESKPSTSI